MDIGLSTFTPISQSPKGIVLKHSNFQHEVELSAQFYGLDSSVVVLQQSAFGFDIDAELALYRLKDYLEEQERMEGSSQSPISQPFELLPLGEWAVRAQAAGMHVLLGAVFENADREKKGLHFPRFVKRRLLATDAASRSK
ncbi:hypothetical protein F5Y19DRAFT_474004 [Xylariaceae sp. FL1651]|nr:hypothetical protein F5Y19DRAFT_474004 [Xylariaceae sp. FL1651]